MIAAAGTGGHIYPGLAIADYFQKKKHQVSWTGTAAGMENKLVNKKLINFYIIRMKGVRGKGLVEWIKLPFRLMASIYESILILRKENPSFVVLMGGYICFPIAIAAKLLSIKIVIHEQNAIAGLSNKLLSKISSKTFLGFKNNIKDGLVVGNPIRESLYEIPEVNERFKGRSGPLRILVIGGSLGALVFNETLPAIFSLVNSKKRIEVIHQSGAMNYEKLNNNYSKYNLNVKTKKYIEDMGSHLAWADLVIARAGALTVSELLELGIASILIPYPFAVDDHQLLNAKVLKIKSATKIILEKNIKEGLTKLLLKIDRVECMRMAMNAKTKLRQQACKNIYEYLITDEK
ncbi:undecaprenyldiphospho-muramoylpentapeptide beta-N-acetylglucosaminyltransferase [Methylophilaceae bacterium]|nr:undecaprenyldiphospho-muramoylpentapeptide beta-N-acetylglucosaminyltransferase [Methylophilaceae bacterium]